MRNTRVIDIVKELEEYGIEPQIADPVADAEEAKRIYGLEFSSLDDVKDMDAVILAVAHDCFKGMDISGFFGEGKKVLLDVKGILNPEDYKEYSYWRL